MNLTRIIVYILIPKDMTTNKIKLENTTYRVITVGGITTIVILKMDEGIVFSSIEKDYDFEVIGQKGTKRAHFDGGIMEDQENCEGNRIGSKYHFGFNDKSIKMVIFNSEEFDVYPMNDGNYLVVIEADGEGMAGEPNIHVYLRLNNKPTSLKEVSAFLIQKDFNELKERIDNASSYNQRMAVEWTI